MDGGICQDVMDKGLDLAGESNSGVVLLIETL